MIPYVYFPTVLGVYGGEADSLWGGVTSSQTWRKSIPAIIPKTLQSWDQDRSSIFGYQVRDAWLWSDAAYLLLFLILAMIN